MSVLPVGMGSSGVDVGDIGHSLRLRASASAYLSRTWGAAPTSRTTMATSIWIKRSKPGREEFVYGDSGNYESLKFEADDTIRFTGPYMAAQQGILVTTQVFRDPSAVLHIVAIYDTTNATAGDRLRLYINGVRVTSFSTNTASNQNNTTTMLGVSGQVNYFGILNASTSPIDGYFSRIVRVDGTVSDASPFGYFNTEINEWVSKSQSQVLAVVEAGGTNSFMLDFDDASSLITLGYDKSTKNNDWTLNNVSLTAGVTYDHMLDVPGNSYCTWNPINNKGGITLSNAALNAASASVSKSIIGTMPFPTSGRFWVEFPIGAMATNGTVGITTDAAFLGNGSEATVLSYRGTTGEKNVNNSISAYGATYGTGDVIGMDVDVTGGNVTFYKQTAGAGAFASQGSISYATSGGNYYPFAHVYNGNVDLNCGQHPLNNSSIPGADLALCQANLPETGTVTVSGSFTGNAAADGPFVWMNGVPLTLTINGNAVTFGTHADKTAGGFKLRTSSASYNTAGSNTWTATITSDVKNLFKYRNAQGNP